MKKYSKLIAFTLLIIVLLCAAACGKSNSDDESSQAPVNDESSTAASDPIPMFEEIERTTYVYEKDGMGDAFNITISSNGTFDYCESSLSSYLGHGEWKLEDGIITLTDETTYSGETARTNKFRYESDCLTYIAEGSNGFRSSRVKDGEKFPIYDEERDKDRLIIISYRGQTKTFKNNDTGYTLHLHENNTYNCEKNTLDHALFKGEWTMDGNIVTLTGKYENGKKFSARFEYDGNCLTYIAEGSDGDMLYGTSDGEKFYDTSRATVPGE